LAVKGSDKNKSLAKSNHFLCDFLQPIYVMSRFSKT
jgi:hypothetical protein